MLPGLTLRQRSKRTKYLPISLCEPRSSPDTTDLTADDDEPNIITPTRRKARQFVNLTEDLDGDVVMLECRSIKQECTTRTGSDSPASSAKELAFCAQVLNNLRSPRYAEISRAFVQPIQRFVVRQPLDLLFVGQRLERGVYHNADEFEADIRLMFDNFFRRTSPRDSVYLQGRQFERRFEWEWAKRRDVCGVGSSRNVKLAGTRKRFRSVSPDLGSTSRASAPSPQITSPRSLPRGNGVSGTTRRGYVKRACVPKGLRPKKLALEVMQHMRQEDPERIPRGGTDDGDVVDSGARKRRRTSLVGCGEESDEEINDEAIDKNIDESLKNPLATLGGSAFTPTRGIDHHVEIPQPIAIQASESASPPSSNSSSTSTPSSLSTAITTPSVSPTIQKQAHSPSSPDVPDPSAPTNWTSALPYAIYKARLATAHGSEYSHILTSIRKIPIVWLRRRLPILYHNLAHERVLRLIFQDVVFEAFRVFVRYCYSGRKALLQGDGERPELQGTLVGVYVLAKRLRLQREMWEAREMLGIGVGVEGAVGVGVEDLVGRALGKEDGVRVWVEGMVRGG